MIQSPGLYAMSEEEYRGDPCPEPSLNQSIAKVLLRSCPYAAWHIHPRLNIDYSPKESDRFNLANVAHRLLLGRGKEYRTVNANDWRTGTAQEQKKAIRNSGFVPILERQFVQASFMANAAKLYLSDHPDGKRIFKPDYGDGEMVIACLDHCREVEDKHPWTRAMIDWLEHRSPDGNKFLCVDYKTTDLSANPKELTHQQKRNWAFQAAFQKRILEHIKPSLYPRFLFLVQETEEPWLCSLNEPSPPALIFAENQVAEAIYKWRNCLNYGVWPGYEKSVFLFDVWEQQQPLLYRVPVELPVKESPPTSSPKKRGRPKMTLEQKEQARSKREAAKQASEYIEERKEIINDNTSHTTAD